MNAWENDISGKIIGAAIEVHKHLGPGLLESAYEECLCRELELRGINFERQVPLPLNYSKSPRRPVSFRGREELGTLPSSLSLCAAYLFIISNPSPVCTWAS